MRVLIWLQAMWCAYWLVLVIPWVSRVISVPSVAFTAGTVVYIAATAGLSLKSRVSWVYSLFPPLLALYFAGPNIVANAIAFVADDPMYLDSPGTIMVVAFQALFRLVPATALIILLFRVRRAVFT